MSLPWVEPPESSSPINVTRNAYVRVRHSAKCRDRDKGPKWEKCNCRKWLFKYDSSKGPQTEKESARTRSWTEAEAKALAWLDQFNPDKVRIRLLEAEKTAKEGTAAKIETAIAKYIQDKQVRLKREPSTVTRAKRVLGDVDPQTFEVKQKGLLLKWLDTLSPRPIFVSDLTSDHITDFVTTWAQYKNSTITSNWTTLKNFFKVCRVRKWISLSPCQDIETPGQGKEEDSIAHFTDEEYSKIQAEAVAQAHATANHKGNSLSLFERQERQRVFTIVELMRYSGMALVDATEFRQEYIRDGVLTYWRRKTRKKAKKPAVVLLPDHVLELLRTVPPANGTPEQPFRNSKVIITSDTGRWRRLFQWLCEDAGVKEVQTDAGPKKPHPHMLRHTFAVDMIRKPGCLTRDVALMLGDTEKIVEDTYLKFSDTLKDALVERMRQWVQSPPTTEPTKDKVVQMGGRRGK